MVSATRRVKPSVTVAYRPRRRQPIGTVRGLLQLSTLIAAILVLWTIWETTATPVVIEVDGIADTVMTHRRDLGSLLSDIDLLPEGGVATELELAEGASAPARFAVTAGSVPLVQAVAAARAALSGGGLDIDLGAVPVGPAPALRLSHSLHTPLEGGMKVSVERKPRYLIRGDGRDVEVASWADTPSALLEDAGIAFNPHDRLLLDGVRTEWERRLPAAESGQIDPDFYQGPAWERVQRRPVEVRIQRSRPLIVHEGPLPYTIHTVAPTVGEALTDAGIVVYLGDKVEPSLSTPVSAGLELLIQRSTPITILADGRLIKTRTLMQTVGDAVTESGVGISGLDTVRPPLDAELFPDIEIAIVRVTESILLEEEIAPYETVRVGDPELLIDTRRVEPGQEGITRWRYRIRYEDGQEASRMLEDAWVAQTPRQQVISIGQKIVPQTFATPNGQEITYWRRIRMRATSYSAATAGTSPSLPWYGLTRTGDPMRKGVVAVDPSVIPLRTKVYVPGYGFGDALDTGGAIKQRRIDLGYDDHNLVLWSNWVDVYLLWPPPPPSQITWEIPSWPIEPPQ